MSTAVRVATLAWNDDKGRVTATDTGPLQHALAGADLVDAIACGAVAMEDDRVVEGPGTAGIPADATEAVGRVVMDVRKRRRPRKAKDLITTLATSKRQQEVVDELAAAGILAPRPRRWWIVDLAPTHHLTDPDDVEAQRAHLAAVLRGQAPPDGLDDRTLAAVALLAPTSLIDRFVDRKERKAARERAHGLVEDPAVGEAVKQAIEAAEAAMVAIMAAGAVAATSSS